MLDLVYTSQFKKDYKLAQKRHEDLDELFFIIGKLQRQEKLSPDKKDHALTGNYKGYRECVATCGCLPSFILKLA